MHTNLSFIFRGKLYYFDVYIDNREPPCYLFIDIKDTQLVEEFGKEITIKTDFNMRLPKKDDYPELIMLRQALFDAIQILPEFIEAKKRNASGSSCNK